LPLARPATACGHCQRRPPPWDAAWSPFRYSWPLDRLESRYKFSADLAAGRALAELWIAHGTLPPARPDVVVPVPLHRSRLRRRGYNQALELARPLARHWRLPLCADLLQRLRATAAQTELDAVARRRNMRGAFRVAAGAAVPAHVVVLDDVMTTGATLAECARVLKRAGVDRVEVWALARAPVPGSG
jgi:ComF family protein